MVRKSCSQTDIGDIIVVEAVSKHEIMMLNRRKTKQITVGGVAVGGDAPVSVQSMCNTDTRDIKATLTQIQRLAEYGCELVRLAVLDDVAIRALKEIRRESTLPLIADIHFDHRLAIGELRAGVDGLRINPGNIGGKRAVAEVVRAAAERR